MEDLEKRLRKLSIKWISIGRHPSRMNLPEVREAYERCARELYAELFADRDDTGTVPVELRSVE